MNVREWLAARREGVPAALEARILGALPEAGGDIAADLRRAADRLIHEVIDGDRCRDATALLAADALITYCCEAVAEQSPDRLADIS